MTITHEEISKKAREIWEREGRPEGRDMAHWLQAEEELRRASSGNKDSNTERIGGPSLGGAGASATTLSAPGSAGMGGAQTSRSIVPETSSAGLHKEDSNRKRSARRAR